MKRTLRFLFHFLALLVAPLWIPPVGWWLAYSEWIVPGYLGKFLLSWQLIILFGWLIALGILAWLPFALFHRDQRRLALLRASQSLIFLVCSVAGFPLGYEVWRLQVEEFVSRSHPLVNAIHSFEKDNGRPPDSLDELVPNYLKEVPRTGIGTSPEFEYIVGKPNVYDGNPWVLVVHPPCLPMGFDLILYFPMQNYPKEGYGGGIERIGTWGYVHE